LKQVLDTPLRSEHGSSAGGQVVLPKRKRFDILHRCGEELLEGDPAIPGRDDLVGGVDEFNRSSVCFAG
jgi:hypothetical protein